jgi:hypothetical protein
MQRLVAVLLLTGCGSVVPSVPDAAVMNVDAGLVSVGTDDGGPPLGCRSDEGHEGSAHGASVARGRASMGSGRGLSRVV